MSFFRNLAFASTLVCAICVLAPVGVRAQAPTLPPPRGETVSLALPALSFAGALPSGVMVTIPALSFAGALPTGVMVTTPALSFAGALPSGVMVTFPGLEFIGKPPPTPNIEHPLVGQ